MCVISSARWYSHTTAFNYGAFLFGVYMGKRFIDTDIWQSDEFIDSPPEMKLLTIYLTTNCDSVGVFKKSIRLMSFEIGFNVTESMILSCCVTVEKIGENKYWIPSFIDFQYGELSEACRPHKRYIEMLKKENLYERVYKGYTKGINTLEEQDKEQDKDLDKEKNKNKTAKKFKPPVVEEVADYCRQRENFVDANKFIDYYTSNGWMVGRNKMKDWKAAVRNWEKTSRSDRSTEVDEFQRMLKS